MGSGKTRERLFYFGIFDLGAGADTEPFAVINVVTLLAVQDESAELADINDVGEGFLFKRHGFLLSSVSVLDIGSNHGNLRSDIGT